MKTSELKELVDLINQLKKTNLDFKFDYNDILRLDSDDVKLILRNRYNPNIFVLLKFLIYYNNNKDIENAFQQFKHIKGLNIKDTVVDKIVSSKEEDRAVVIYNYFGCDEIVSLFKTEEEWDIYLDSLSNFFDDDCISSFSYFFKKFDKLRVQGIKKVMKFIQGMSLEYLEEIVKLDNNTFSEEDWYNILDLLNEGYEKNGVFRLVLRFKEYKEKDIYKEEISKIKKYLMSDLDNYDDRLPNLFSIVSFDDTENIINFINVVDSNTLSKYLNSTNSSNEYLLRKYFNTILNTEEGALLNAYHTLKTNDTCYFNDLVKESSEERKINDGSSSKLENIMCVLEIFDRKNSDNQNSELHLLVEGLPNIPYHVWVFILYNFDLDNAKLIIKNYKYINYIFDEEISSLKCFFNKSYDDLETIFKILRLDSFKSDSNRLEVYKLMLDEENKNSLNYIYQMYYIQELKQEEIRKQLNEVSCVELETVASLLNRECDLEKILDGFNDNDEITHSSLVRTLKYKNC